MIRALQCGLAAAVLMGLAACGGQTKAAAGDVAAFLEAARTGDRRAIESHVARESLRADVKAQLMKSPEVKALRDQLGDAVGEASVNGMVSAESLQALRADPGLGLPEKATAKDVRPRLKAAGKDRVCLKDKAVEDRCLMTFTRIGKTWKLAGIYAGDIKRVEPVME